MHSKRFQSWGMGRVKLANDDTDLRAASREGALAGALPAAERFSAKLEICTRQQCPKWHSRLWVAAVVGARATGQGSGGHYC